MMWGCSTQSVEPPRDSNETKKIAPFEDFKSASEEIKAFKQRDVGSIPPMILPSPYEKLSIFDDAKITLSANGAKLPQVLYSISKLSGLNLIVDNDVEDNVSITLSLEEAPLKEALEVVMNISGCYYLLESNILHVKQYQQRNFSIPYVHAAPSYVSELGGDVFSSASGGSASSSSGSSSKGLKGEFKIKYENPTAMNNFYEQLERNIASLLSPRGKYTLNAFTGNLSVYDRKRNVDAIAQMVERIKKDSAQQIIIEAKILEVILNDSHSLGVSWDAVANSVLQKGDSLSMQQTLGLSGAVAGTMTYNSTNFSSVINALNENGDVETLSNPSINVLSGQSAVISSGKLIPFWEKEVQITQGTGGSASTTEVTYSRRDVLHGVTMGVTPSVMEDGTIMLNVIPITSSIEEVVDYTDETGRSVASAPILNVKEAGTVIYARNNDLVLIGGLINNTKSKQVSKVPFLGDIPLLGALFSKTVDKDEKRELVILLRLKVNQ